MVRTDFRGMFIKLNFLLSYLWTHDSRSHVIHLSIWFYIIIIIIIIININIICNLDFKNDYNNDKEKIKT